MRTRAEIEEAKDRTLAEYEALPDNSMFGTSNIPAKMGARQAFEFLCPEGKEPPSREDIEDKYDEWWQDAEDAEEDSDGVTAYETHFGIAAQILEWALVLGDFCDPQ